MGDLQVRAWRACVAMCFGFILNAAASFRILLHELQWFNHRQLGRFAEVRASYLQRAYRSWPKDMGLQVSSLQLAFFFPFLKQKMGTRRATDYLPRQLLQQTVCSYAWGGLEAV